MQTYVETTALVSAINQRALYLQDLIWQGEACIWEGEELERIDCMCGPSCPADHELFLADLQRRYDEEVEVEGFPF